MKVFVCSGYNQTMTFSQYQMEKEGLLSSESEERSVW